MDTAAGLIPSKKRKRAGSILNKHQYLPTEMIEEILLNLPPKSLLRFSTASKSWHSMISNPEFARKHKNRAALLHRHRLVVYMNADSYESASFCSLASISSDLRLKVIVKPRYSSDGYAIYGRNSIPFFSVLSATNIDTRDFVGQFEGKPYLLAYCDELWCVQVQKSLYLWNPSVRNIVDITRLSPLKSCLDYLYGLAYDSVNDDYKILQIRRRSPSKTELYSLKNNCWREIKSFSSNIGPLLEQHMCAVVDGRFHWIGFTTAKAPIIVSFDLSTEKYGEVAQPRYEPELNFKRGYYNYYLEVVALRGMLCASLNYTNEGRFVLWVMEEYGIEKSWTKRFDICFSHRLQNLTPFYLSDNNDMILVRSDISSTGHMYIFMYRNGYEKLKKIVTCGDGRLYYEAEAFLYVESLITHKNFSKNISSSLAKVE